MLLRGNVFETLDDVIREAREELSTYRDVLEIYHRIKNLEFSEPRKDFPTAVSNFKKEGESTSPVGDSPGGFKKLGSPTPRFDDLKDVECFKCTKMDIMPITALI